METYRKIMNWKETLEFPEDIQLSPEALDLMKKLITGPESRLGAGENGVNRLLAHPWFKVRVTVFCCCFPTSKIHKGLDWENLRKLPAPIKPIISSPDDTRNFDAFEDSDEEEDLAMVDRSFKRQLDQQVRKKTGEERKRKLKRKRILLSSATRTTRSQRWETSLERICVLISPAWEEANEILQSIPTCKKKERKNTREKKEKEKKKEGTKVFFTKKRKEREKKTWG